MNNILSHIDNLYLPPYSLNLMTTDFCTASCKNCCMQCSPKKHTRLSFEDMRKYIDSALESFPSIKLLVLTGGECFALKNDLKKVVDYSSQKKLISRVVTNGYWATSFKTAYLTLKDLRNAGLGELNLSTGDEHQVWVNYDNIILAAVSALLLGMSVVINVESSNTSNFSVINIFNDIRLRKYLDTPSKYSLKIIGGRWVEFETSKEKKIEQQRYYPSNRINRCTNLFNSITISPNHQMWACCGLSVKHIPYLNIGNTKKFPLKFLHKYQLNDFLKIWIYTEGPMRILEFCKKHGNEDLDLSITNWHPCQACNILFSDSRNIEIINKYYKEIYTNVVFKYLFLRESYVKQLNIM